MLVVWMCNHIVFHLLYTLKGKEREYWDSVDPFFMSEVSVMKNIVPVHTQYFLSRSQQAD